MPTVKTKIRMEGITMPIIFCDTMEIARKDDVDIPKKVVPHHDLIVTHRISLVVYNTMNENEFKNKNLIVLSY